MTKNPNINKVNTITSHEFNIFLTITIKIELNFLQCLVMGTFKNLKSHNSKAENQLEINWLGGRTTDPHFQHLGYLKLDFR